MSTSKISRRYAQALFELISDGVDLHKDLSLVATAACNEEVCAVLCSPEYPAALKHQVIVKVAGGNVCGEVDRLVAMLTERNKSTLLPEISAIVDDMVHRADSQLDASVTVATAISKATETKLNKALAASTGKKVRLTISEDKSILGGLVVQIGDRKIDYSLRTKLNGMRRALAS